MASLICGFLQVPLLVFGACALRKQMKPRRLWLRTGIAVAVAASALSFAAALYYRGQPFTSFAVRTLPRTLALAASLFFCAWVFIGQGRRNRSLASVITGAFCLLYAIDQSSYTLIYINQLISVLHPPVPALPFRLLLSPIAFSLDIVFEFGICLGIVLLLVEAHERTELALLTSNARANVIAESNVSLQAEITERKRTEEALRESEERHRHLVESANDWVWEVDANVVYTYVGPQCRKILGYEAEEIIGKTPFDLMPPEEARRVAAVFASIAAERKPVRGLENINRHKDGHLVSLETNGVPVINREGEFLGYRGMDRDITERKQAEAALASVSRKLIEAQEQERTRIGRELHDDVNQRLAMLAVKLEQLRHSPSDFLNRVQGLREEVSEISSDVQALSHEMHASKLEYLGAVAGMKSWCKEFGGRQRIEVDFRPDVRSRVPSDIGLCLFRVLQEALHNAAKHSGVKRIEVQLHEELGEIHLTIRDSGKGFDIEAARDGRGLGLTSMQERVRLVNGTMTIQSKPMAGTTIHARVSLESAQVPAKTA